MVDSEKNTPADRFSLVQGGLFHAALARLHLVGKDRLPTYRAATLLALAAWLPPALLVVAQTLVDRAYSGWDFFTDGIVYARYLVAIWVMIATERYADGRIVLLIQHFQKAQLISERARPMFAAALIFTLAHRLLVPQLLPRAAVAEAETRRSGESAGA